MRDLFRKDKARKGIVGIEAAIVLIAFVIIAAAFAFMTINMGLFATQRTKDTISQGLREASSPLQVDGNIFLRVNHTDLRVVAFVIPLRSMGVKYVPMGTEETVVSLSISGDTKIAYSNIFQGVCTDEYSPQNKTFDNLVVKALNATGISGWPYSETAELDNNHPNATISYLLVENTDRDESLDASEKGFLVIALNCTTGANEYAHPRDVVTVEIRVEKSAPLTIEFIIPESLTEDSWIMYSG